MSVGARLFQVRRGEGRVVALVVACMFVSVAGLTIGESGISALFFDRIGPGSLPVMYLAQGAVGVAAMLLLSGTLGRLEPSRAYVLLPVSLLAIVGVERAILAGGPPWIYPTLYLTTALATLVQSVYLWGAAGLVTDSRRAKRLFPLFGAGNILGSVIGGLLTKPLADAIGAENLLLMWAAALIAASFLCAMIVRIPGKPRGRRRRRRRSAIGEIAEGFRYVRRSSLLMWMSIGSVLFSVLFYSLYLPFAQAATARYPDPDALAGFLGVFWAAVTATAFFVAILLTNRLLGWFGAAAMVIVLPALYVGAFSILLVTSTFATLVAIRFGVNVWLQGVASPSWETLANVTTPERRDQTRAFLNGGPAQIGTAIAGVIALVGQDVLTPRQLSMIGLVAAIGTVIVTWMIRRSYGGALVDVIRAGRPDVFDEPVRGAPIAVDRDAQTISLGLEALAGEDARIRRLATHVLGTSTSDDERVRAALEAAVGDPDPGVRASAVDALGRRSWLDLDVAHTALADADPQVRRAAVMHEPDPALLMNELRDPDPSVAAAAAARLLGGDAALEARGVLERQLAGSAEVRVATLRALASASVSEAGALARPHTRDPSPPVRVAAFEVLAGTSAAVAVPSAIEALGAGDPLTVDAAMRAIDAVGVDGFDGQLARVVEEHRDRAVADGRLASQVATTDDAERLLRDALRSLARAEASVAFSAASVTATDPAAMRTAVDALRSGDPHAIADALEVIEVAGSSVTVRPLVALWESSESGPAVTDPEALATARAHPDPFIRACAELAADDAARGGTMTSTPRSLSTMEMVLLLRRVELFAALEPADLERVAAIAEERTFGDGAVIAEEGELGDELYIVLEGNVQVARADGSTVASRGQGEVIGELSLLRRSSRMASLVADGDVRTVGIRQPAFEGMIRDRPEIGLAIMRMLADRLTAASAPSEPPG